MKLTDWLQQSNKEGTQGTVAGPGDKMPPKEKKAKGEEEVKGKGQTPRNSTGGGGASSGGNPGLTTTSNGNHSTKTKGDVVLPQTKVKVIMKSSPGVDQVGADVLYLVTKAAELFIDHLTTMSHKQAQKGKSIEYKHLSDMAHKQENMEFLRDIIPVKMLARDALKEMAKQKAISNRELLGD